MTAQVGGRGLVMVGPAPTVAEAPEEMGGPAPRVDARPVPRPCLRPPMA